MIFLIGIIYGIGGMVLVFATFVIEKERDIKMTNEDDYGSYTIEDAGKLFDRTP